MTKEEFIQSCCIGTLVKDSHGDEYKVVGMTWGGHLEVVPTETQSFGYESLELVNKTPMNNEKRSEYE